MLTLPPRRAPRSGKSALAVQTGVALGRPGPRHHLVATARSARRRDGGTYRPPPFRAARSMGHARRAARPRSGAHATTDDGTVVIDCLTLWVANLLGSGPHRCRKSSTTARKVATLPRLNGRAT